MENKLINKLFSCIGESSAEDLWLVILKDYQRKNEDVSSVCNPENQWTLLHYAAENLFTRVAEWLIEQGAEVDALDSEGNTPFLIGLDAAVDCSVQENSDDIDFSIVTLLLRNGANADVISNDGTDKDTLLNIYGSHAVNQYYEKVSVYV